MIKEFIISLVHSVLWSFIFLLLIPYIIISILGIDKSKNIYTEVAGYSLILIGSFICIKAMYDLAKEKGTTTLLRKSRRLVRSGVYGKVRNPIYVGVLLILTGIFFLYPSVATFLYILLMFSGLHMWVVRVEEPLLKREFGADFEKYEREVPRWLCKIKKSS